MNELYERLQQAEYEIIDDTGREGRLAAAGETLEQGFHRLSCFS